MSSNKPRVLFVINSLAGGGAERIMARLLGLSKARTAVYDIHLALLDRADKAYPIPDWVKVHQLDARGNLFRSIWQLSALVRRMKPAIRVSFLTRANITSGLAALCRHGPWVISERINTAAHLGSGARGRFAGAMVRAIYPRASAIIAVSDGVAQDLKRCFGVRQTRVVTIPNPVAVDQIRASADAEPGLPVTGPYVFAMGRLTPSKNFAMLLRAFAAASLPAKLVIAGEGPQRGDLELLAAELGIGDSVIFAGFLANPYATMKRAQLFALSSNVEGFPNALVEALALDIPAVATNCPDGPAEILAGKRLDEIHGPTRVPAGMIVPCEDAQAFAAALSSMFAEARDGALGDAGRRTVARFEPQAVADRYWAIIEQQLVERSCS